MSLSRCRLALLPIAALLCLLAAQTSHAATIVVGKTSCTLIEAIQSANGDRAVGNCAAGSGADTLDLSNLDATTNIYTAAPLDPITSDITINGANKTLSAEGNTRHFVVNRGGKLTLNNLTLETRNAAKGKIGGALLVRAGGAATVRDSSLSQNAASSGGAIYSSGSLTIINSSFPVNEAGHDTERALGGAIYMAGGSMTITDSAVGSIYGANVADAGGGVYIAGGSATITHSSIEHNNARNGDGGGIYVAAGARLHINDSTLASNDTFARGGGIFFAGGLGVLSHVTIFNNETGDSTQAYASGLHVAGGSVSLRNSVIYSGVTNNDCTASVALAQNIGNLIGDGACSPAASGNPMFVPNTTLPYYLPNAGSPALEIGGAAICRQFARDQRGYYRPETACDAGSVERLGHHYIHVSATCSLANAFLSAKGDSANGGCKAGVSDNDATDVIWLKADVALSSQLTDIDSNIILDGGGNILSRQSGVFRPFNVLSGGELTLRRITISGFTQTSGAAVLSAGKLTLRDCLFKDNTDTSQTGGGGAVRAQSGQAGTTIDRCAFVGNRSDNDHGGALKIDGGDVIVSNSSFIDNSCGGMGCAAYVGGGNVELSHNTFWNNAADSAGNTSGIHAASGSVDLQNSIVGRDATAGGRLCGGTFNDMNDDRGIIMWNGPTQNNPCGKVTVADPRLGEERGFPTYMPLSAGSPARGRGIVGTCAAYPIDQRGASRPAANCDIGAVQSIAASSSTGASVSAWADPDESDSSDAPTCAGERLNRTGMYRITVSYGLCSGIQFNRLDFYAIGIGYVIEAGPLDAIDVWGWVTSGVEVCFRRQASTLFLDAADSPRTVGQLASTWDGEWTCAAIDRAGTIVLLPADSYLTTAPADADALASHAGTSPLADCMAELLYILNFRESPGGEIMMRLPHRIKLTAFLRTADWVEVDYHGTRGWISAHHVAFEGSC